MRVLVTGGAGYIGSHTVVELAAAGFDVHVLDNVCNSERWILQRLAALCGREIPHSALDLLDEAGLDACFAAVKPDALIHFAALKAVGESVQQPLRCCSNNVGGSWPCCRPCSSTSATIWCSAARPPCTAIRTGTRPPKTPRCGRPARTAGASGWPSSRSNTSSKRTAAP